MSNTSAKIDEVMLNLKLDSKIAITWFIDNGMEPHPEKFQFMVMSSNVIDTHTLELDDTTRLRSQSDVVLLAIKIDDKLTFTKHVYYNECVDFIIKLTRMVSNKTNGI